VTAARWVRDHTPPEAVVMAMQHSGSVTYYGHRDILRYDFVDGARLDDVVTSLREGGRPAYLLVDAWEEGEFRRRFSGHGEIGSLDWPPLAEIAAGVRVRLYELPGRPDTRTRQVPFSPDGPWRRLLPAGSGWLAPAADPVR